MMELGRLMGLDEELSRLARWTRMGNNRRDGRKASGSLKTVEDFKSDELMQDEASARDAQEPEMVTGDEFPLQSGQNPFEVEPPDVNAIQAELAQVKVD